MSIDRLPPHSIESEQSLLGAAILDRRAIEVALDTGVIAEDFYRAAHSNIWKAMVSLFDNKKPVDMVTVSEELERNGVLAAVGGSAYLTSLLNLTPTSINAWHYATVVRDKSIRRQLIGAAGRIAGIAYEETTDIESMLDKADTALKRPRERAPGSVKQPDPQDIIKRLEGEKISGIPTRLPALNAMTTGMIRSHLWVIGGNSSLGKSSVAVNLAEDVVKGGGAVAVMSTEMSQEQYMLRLLSLTSGVPQRIIRHGGGMTLDQAAAYASARDFWKSAKIRVFDDLYTTARIKRKAAKVKEEIGLDVLIVDFVQNLGDTGDEVRDARLASIELQNLAKQLDVCVVGLSQISNSMASRQFEEGVTAGLYNFKGSGSWKDAADVAIMLDRDRENLPEVMALHVVKNRHDMIGTIRAHYDLPTGRLTQMLDDEWIDIDPNAGRKSKRVKKIVDY